MTGKLRNNLDEFSSIAYSELRPFYIKWVRNSSVYFRLSRIKCFWTRINTNETWLLNSNSRRVRVCFLWDGFESFGALCLKDHYFRPKKHKKDGSSDGSGQSARAALFGRDDLWTGKGIFFNQFSRKSMFKMYFGYEKWIAWDFWSPVICIWHAIWFTSVPYDPRWNIFLWKINSRKIMIQFLRFLIRKSFQIPASWNFLEILH